MSSSPFRRRHGEHQRQLAELVEPLDVALRNTRVVVRRVAVACYRREPVPASYASLMRDLADLSDRVADELVADRMAEAVIDDLIALGRATAQVEHSDDLSAEVILAQVRSIVADMLALCGMDPLEATDVIPLRLGHRSDLVTTTSSWVPLAVGSPVSTVQPSRVRVSASALGVRGLAPSSSSARTMRPLVALLKWLTTDRLPADSWSTRTVATRRARRRVRPPEGGVRPGAEVDEQAGADRLGDGLAEDLAPRAGDRTGAGQAGVAGEPVGRDPVAGPHDAEERARDRHPRGRPAAGRGGEGVEAEGVVEDAGVDRVGAGGRGVLEVGVALHQVALGGTEAEHGGGLVRVVAAQPHERLEQRRPGGGEGRRGQRAEVEGLAATGSGLALAGRQQDQHGRKRRERRGCVLTARVVTCPATVW